MAYVALYRAYRPQKFADVVGQEHIIKTLQNAIAMNKVAHAYLFCGPRGTGKTTLAKIMAKALNCEHGPCIEPCDECDICKGITKGTISDVIEIDAASNNGADDIRALRDGVKYLPAVGKYKVYIIDEVHMLSNAAFNALLKTLEEPPKHVIFILATTEPYKLPNTILSRCQRFDFQSISIDDIAKRLQIVADSENIKLTEEAKHQIAASAEGGMRDALSLFDQCISYSTHEEITVDDVLAVSGNVGYLKIIEILNSCINKEDTKAISLLDSILKEGKEVPRVINDMVLFLRDVLLFKNNAVIEEKLMYKNENFISLANRLSKALIYHFLDVLNDALSQMRFSTQKRAYLELAILKMNDDGLNSQYDLADKVKELEYTINMLNDRINNMKFTPAPAQVRATPSSFVPTEEEIKNLFAPKKENPVPKANPYESDVAPEDIFASPAASAPVVSEPVVERPVEVISPVVPVMSSVSDSSSEITVRDIEKVLYNASKQKKEKLNEVWNQISERYSNQYAIQIMVNGNIVAVSDDAFIVELKDAGFCNRIMKYENYVKLMEIFNEFDLNIKDYICVPTVVWKKIIADYKSKYSKENPNPVLDDISIGVKKRVIPVGNDMPKQDENEAVNTALNELFTDKLKIVEE